MVSQIVGLWDESTNEVVRDGVEPVAPAFELLTHLGDGALLLVAGVLMYWFGTRGNRRSRAFVIAVGTAALALSAGVKGVVQLPRPELAFSPEAYPGYTFPSAHAMGSAAFYGALAVTMEWSRRRWRYLLAGTIIAVVALSRVVMGVHYVGDVLVGAGLGLALVWIGLRIRDEGLFDPGPMFVLATAIAVVAALLGSRQFLTLTIGASIGGTIGWYYVRDRPTTDVGAAVLVLGVLAIAGIAAVRVTSVLLGIGIPGLQFDTVQFLAEVVAYGVLTTAVLALPHLAIRIEDRPIVWKLQSTLPFRGRTVDGEAQLLDD